MPLTQAHFLLMLAEDHRQKGEDLAKEMRQRGIAHAREAAELSTLIERARDIIEAEKSKWALYSPVELGQNYSTPNELKQPPRIRNETTPNLQSPPAHPTGSTTDGAHHQRQGKDGRPL
jgi:hypothetical protein